MNTGFYKDLDTNFEQALEMSEREFAHDELVEMLKNGNIPQKQIAAMKLDKIMNQGEADILISNLTGCDGKIREAVALRINTFLKEHSELIRFFNKPKVFADASVDINGNICRLVIESVSILKQNKDFTNAYLEEILSFIEDAFIELDKFIFRDKKYVINKQLFKLYWCLEALKGFVLDIPFDKISPIIDRASQEREYTIREKAAQIISLLASDTSANIRERLEKDENYYVRNALKKHH